MSKVHFKACPHIKRLSDLINMSKVCSKTCQLVKILTKYLIQSLSIYQKASQHFPNKLYRGHFRQCATE